jgi:mRNA interferase MazF
LTTRAVNPKRGEVWQVDFNPSVGSEITKARPAVVVSSDSIGALPVKLVVPLTEWQDKFGRSPWHVRVEKTSENGLDKASAADTLQTRSVDLMRFVYRRGLLHAETMEEVAAALAAVIEYQ